VRDPVTGEPVSYPFSRITGKKTGKKAHFSAR
jgi:hypothetical protein